VADYRAKNRNNKAGDLARVRAAAKFSTPAPKATGIGSAAAVSGIPLRGGAGAAGAAGIAAIVASALLPKLVGPSVEESKLGLGIAGAVIAPGVAGQQVGGFLADRIGRPTIMGTPRNDSTPQVFTRTPAISQTRPSVLSTPTTNEDQSRVSSYPTTTPDVSSLITLMRSDEANAIYNQGDTPARYPEGHPQGPGGDRKTGKTIEGRQTTSFNYRSRKDYPADAGSFPPELKVTNEDVKKFVDSALSDPRNAEYDRSFVGNDASSAWEASHPVSGGLIGKLGRVDGIVGGAANRLEATARQGGANIKSWNDVFDWTIKNNSKFANETIESLAGKTGAAHLLKK